MVVVEGADRKYPKASEKGLSVDNTSKEISKVFKMFPNKKRVYRGMGFVDDKIQLRQECIDIVYKRFRPSPSDWGLFVDADEVWSDGNWEKLMEALKLSSHAGSVYFNFLHFWKQPDLVAVGGQWDSKLFRLFRFVEPKLQLTGHAQEPVCQDGHKVSERYGRIDTSGIYLHHYGYCKDSDDVQNKIAYYAKRDTHLSVTDTWTDWEKGKDTQPTHGGGSVENYHGLHPIEVKPIFGKTALYDNRSTPRSTKRNRSN